MKTAYLDCFSGISGNMVLGALVDLGIDIDRLKSGLDALDLGNYELKAARVKKQSIAAVYVYVVPHEPLPAPMRPDEILDVIEGSRLSPTVRKKAREVFQRMFEAESRMHATTMEELHLHEIGETDTLVDVVGSLLGLEMLGVEQVISSPVNLGRGLVRCRHGLLPVPAPMTAELVRGAQVYSDEVEGELTTPTGAAIVTGTARAFGPLPLMTVTDTGYGAGSRDLSRPNLLRILLGETPEAAIGDKTGPITVLETNIDDMNPQLYGHVMERLFEAGALDVYLTPVQMKKNRPGVLLTVLAERDNAGRLAGIILQETTTLGVRVSSRDRFVLPRSFINVDTPYGRVRVKLAGYGEAVKAMPEYDDCVKLAEAAGVPARQVYLEVESQIGRVEGLIVDRDSSTK